MIVVDEDADRRLVKALETHRSTPGSLRCLALRLANYPRPRAKAEMIRLTLLQTIQQTTLPNAPQVFWCEDGDIFILAPFLSSRSARSLMAEIANLLDIPAREDTIAFLELPAAITELLLSLEAKLAKQEAVIAAAKQRHEAQLTQKKRSTILNNPIDIKASEIAVKRAERKSPEMMIVEDDAFSRRLVENVLKKAFTLHALANADFALATYARTAPDIVFLDIDLPDVTGHELLERIIALDPNAYVVMLSGNADRENIMQAMNRGAKGFIGKPFTREKLFHYIDRYSTLQRQKEGV